MYPMKMHLLDFGPNLLRDLAQYEHKKYNQIYAGDSSFIFVGLYLLRNPTVHRHRGYSIDHIHHRVDYICQELFGQTSVYSHASGMLQNSLVHALCHSILMRVFGNRLHFSDSPTCHNSSNLPSQYSPLLLDFKHLSFEPDSFLTWANHFLNISNTSDLCFKKYIETFLLETSMKVTKYNKLLREKTEVLP